MNKELTKDKCEQAVLELSVYAKYNANEVEKTSLNKCAKLLKRLINEYFGLKWSYGIVKRQNDTLLKMCSYYEKALDKACEELESYDYDANLKPGHWGVGEYKKADEWKEWCLKREI